MDKEQFVWVANHPEFEWWPCKVVERNDRSVVAEDNTGQRFTIPLETAVFLKPASVRNVADLLHLDEFTEGHLLHAVRARFFEDDIYTAVGSQVLLAVNPYKSLDCYNLERRAALGDASPSDLIQSAPHIFKIAELAYRNLQEGNGGGQNVLISGESGAGKTESAKFVIGYLAGRGGHSQLEKKIVSTNPLLEAFGNAQTVRNENSSRFGKFVQLCFREGALHSGHIESYLLEKSRVVGQAPNERNYHIFYQLFFGSDESTDARLQLRATAKYEYLNLEFPKMEEKARQDQFSFGETLREMALVGFSAETREAIVDILAGILHLGNLRISGGSEGSLLHPDCPHKSICARLLGISPEKLEHLICFRPILDPSTKTFIRRNVDRNSATVNRDTLAQTIYDRLFAWLISEINNYISSTNSPPNKASTIGVLDIFGFEIFGHNSLEQLCINYANERLQLGFNDDIFRAEQKLYADEGVAEAYFPFRDNQRVVDLIDKRPTSVFSLLEEACLFQNSSDAALLERLRLKFEKHEDFISRNLKAKKECFGIRHFAGDVFYSVDGFLDKNRNATNSQLIDTLFASSNKVLAMVFVREKEAADIQKGSKRTENLVSHFSNQLGSLVAKLSGSYQLYVRCLKPNKYKAPDIFDSADVMLQLKAVGVLDVIRIRKAGFPVRKTFAEFQDHYSCVFKGMPKTNLVVLVTTVLKTFGRFLTLKALKNNLASDPSLIRGSGSMSLAVLRLLILDQRHAKSFLGMLEHFSGKISPEKWIKFGKSKIFLKEEAQVVLEFVRGKAVKYFGKKVARALVQFRQLQLKKRLGIFIGNVRLFLRIRRALRAEVAGIKQQKEAVAVLFSNFRRFLKGRALKTGVHHVYNEIVAAREKARLKQEEEERERLRKLALTEPSPPVEAPQTSQPEVREAGEKIAQYESERPEVLQVKRTLNPVDGLFPQASKKKPPKSNFKLAAKSFPDHVLRELELEDRTGPPAIDIVDVHKAVSNILDINRKKFKSYADGNGELEFSNLLFEKENQITEMRKEIAELKEKMEAERAEKHRKEGEFELTVGRLKQEVQEKDGILAALRKELRVVKAENKDQSAEIGLLREELYKTRQQSSDPILKRETIENLASLNLMLEEKEKEKHVWQRKCGEAVESLEILRAANQKMASALKDKDGQIEQLRNAQSDYASQQSHLYSRLAIERESLERRGGVYKEVVEVLLTLLKWKTIDLKLNENLAHCGDSGKAQEIRANIRQLRAEEEEMREHLEAKMQELQGEETAEDDQL